MEHDEIIELVNSITEQLSTEGYQLIVKKDPVRMKQRILAEELERLGFGNAFVGDIGTAIYDIADYLTGNYTRRGHGIGRTCTNRYVFAERVDDYRQIVSSLLTALSPYYVPGLNGGRGRFEPKYDELDLRTH